MSEKKLLLAVGSVLLLAAIVGLLLYEIALIFVYPANPTFGLAVLAGGVAADCMSGLAGLCVALAFYL